MKKTRGASNPVQGKKDKFYGDRSVVLTQKQLELVKENPKFGELYLSDIGFYPHAKNHYRSRTEGNKENILIYCTDGAGSIKIRGKTYPVFSNSFFVIPAGVPHAYWSSPDAPWSIYWVHFGGRRSAAFQQHYGKVNTFTPSGDARLKDRIDLFNEILNVLEAGFNDENIEYSNLWLNSLLASFFYVDTYRAAKGFQGSDPVDHAIFFMIDNLNKPLTITEIAQSVSLSDSHFSKIFRNKTGSSPLDYFINLKMQEAIRLLTNQSLRIKEVAFILGYKDSFYFSRIFTKHIGKNPKLFLKTSKR